MNNADYFEIPRSRWRWGTEAIGFDAAVPPGALRLWRRVSPMLGTS
ncbi:hypothetical protein [Actinoalloteichus sp. GBA129-24]|nr:hypothetical protein [Actinoalloteichus sp. GBA129-24]